MNFRSTPSATISFLAFMTLAFTAAAAARDTILPAGTLLKCTLNEPNFSTNAVSIRDPVVCHLRGQIEFGLEAFPRGSYLVGHLDAAKDPGHFVGKGYLQLRFDRIGLPSGDMPIDAKMIAAGKYRVDREGKIAGKATQSATLSSGCCLHSGLGKCTCCPLAVRIPGSKTNLSSHG
jgi:hypothetical protein